MRRLHLCSAFLMLAACSETHQPAATEARSVTETRTSREDGLLSRTEGRGKIIDQALSLRPGDTEGLTQELAEIDRLGGPQVTVVLVRPTSGESMEQIGWALAGRPTGRALVLLANPDSGAVRIEGSVPAETKARIAGAMQQHLKAGKPAEALGQAIAILKGAR